MKKRFTMLLASLLLVVGTAWAQTETMEKGPALSADELNALSEATDVVIQNVSGTNNWYLAGDKNVQSYEENSEAWFVVEPVLDDGQATGTFYLKKKYPSDGQGEGYLQKAASIESNVTIGAKSTAQLFSASATTISESNLTAAAAGDEKYIRFLLSGTDNRINCNSTGGVPYYCGNNKNGGYTIHNVYTISEKLVDITISEVNSAFLDSWTTSSWTTLSDVPDAAVAAAQSGGNDSYAALTSEAVQGYSQVIKIPEGNLSVGFKYSNGANRLDIVGVDLLNAEGEVAYSDYHFGFSGGNKVNNVYTMYAAEAGIYTMRYWVVFGPENNSSDGTITVASWNIDTDKTYRLKSKTSGLCLEIADFEQTSGEGALQLKNKALHAGQLFAFGKGDGYVDGQYNLSSVKEATTYYVNAASWNFYAGTESTTPFTVAIVAGESDVVYSLYQSTAAYKGYAGNINGNLTDGAYVYNNQNALNGSTTWVLEEVDDAYEQECKTAKDALAAVLEDANEALVTASFSDTPIALQVGEPTAAGYVSCSNLDTSEGNNMEWLIDGKPGTYIHSNYHDASATNDYLDVYLGEGNGVSLFYFTELSRSGASNDYPKSVEILGSTDGIEYIPLTTVNGLPQTGGQSYTSPLVVSDSSYIYLRFVVTTGTNRKYFHMAEFGLHAVAIDEAYAGRVSIYRALNFSAESAKSLQEMIVPNDPEATNTSKSELATWLERAVRTYPFVLTTDDNNPALYAIKSGRTNDGKGWWYTFDDSDGKIALSSFTAADNQYWYFKEVVKNDNLYLQLYPFVGEGKAMSYTSTGNDAASVVVESKQAADASYNTLWQWETTNGVAPYGLQTEGKENRLSNNGGVGNKMGMWNASPSSDTGSAMYLFAKPIYPFTPTIDDANPELYAIKSGRTDDNKEWWYTYVTAEGDNQYEIALSNTYTGDDTQMWYFKEVASDKNGHGLQLYPYLGEGKAISYTSTANQRGDIKAVALGTEGTNNIWIFETTNGNAPYGLQTEGKENRLSNNGGVTNTMGLWNASPSSDTGSAMYIISSALDDAVAELNELAKLSIYTEKATAAIEQARICNNRAGIEEIVLNVKKSIDGQNVKLKLKATDVRVGKFLGYDVANGRVAAVLSSGDDVIWTLKANDDGTVKLYNWVHDKYLGVPGDPTALVSEAEAAAFEIKVTANNTMALAIGEDKMLHIANHTNFKAINYYSLTDPASLWEVTPIGPIVVTRKEYDRFAEVASLAPTYLYALLGQYGLVKEAAKYTSNWKSEQEGSFEALLDGDYTTYFHSAYTNEAKADTAAAHYIQAELESPVSGFYFYMKKRLQNDANRPVSITVYGCDTSGGSFEKIADVETTLAETEDYLSAKIECNTPYQYLRFEVNSTNNDTKFFTLSEFYLLPAMSFLVEPYREFKATSITSADFILYATAFNNAYLLETASATQLFRLKNTASGRYMTIVDKDVAAGIKIKDKMDASVGQAFYFLKTDSLNVFQIKSTEGYFMTAFNAWDYKASQSDKAQETAHGLEYVGEGKYRLHTWKGYAGPNNGTSAEDSPLYSNHDLANQNIAWELEPMTMSSVTYVYKYNDTEIGRESHENVWEGFSYPEPTVALPFGFVAFAPEGAKKAEDETIEMICELNLPFEYAADYNSITKWYYLNIRDDDPTYLYYDPSVEYIKATEHSVPADEKDAYTWAFVGNPIDGFSIVNYKAGASMVLSAPNTPSKNQDAGQLARMVVAEGATGNKVWDFVTPTHTHKNPAPVAGAFYVQHPDAAAWALNRQTYQGMNVVCYWNNRDTGSDLQVVERNDYKELTDLINAAKSMNVIAEGLGTYTEATVTTFNEKLEAAEAITESSGLSAIVEAAIALQEAIDGLEIILPVSGKYYRLRNAVSNRYMSGNASSVTVIDDGTEVASTIFYLDEGNKLLSYTQGRYLDCNARNLAAVGTAHEGVFDVAYGGATANVITYKNNGYWTYGNRGDGVSIDRGSSAPNEKGYNWIIEEVTTLPLTVSAVGYASFYAPVEVTVPDGIAAYAIEEGKITQDNEDGTVKLSDPITVIPANTGVILYANGGGDFELDITNTKAQALEGNLLSGASAKTLVEGDAYVLANKDRGIGLYPVALTRDESGATGGTTHFLNGANKAYLPKSAITTSNVRSLIFRFGDTGVEDMQAVPQHTLIYDLMGRPVERMEKGIYIVNGRKVVK